MDETKNEATEPQAAEPLEGDLELPDEDAAAVRGGIDGTSADEVEY